MIDDRSVLNVLARRQSQPKVEPPRDDSAIVTKYLLQSERDKENAERTLRSVMATANAEKDSMQAEITSLREQASSLQTQLAEASSAKSSAEMKVAMLEARPALVATQDNSRSDGLMSENTDLKVKVSALEAEVTERKRMEILMREQNDKLSTRILVLETPETDEVETTEAPEGYDIEVLRGGDDRIRTLRVRYT